MDAAIEAGLARALGGTVVDARRLSGGDINEAYATTMADGRLLFVKTNRRSPANMFQAEAAGLNWLRDARSLRVPRVVAVEQRFLALEFVHTGRRHERFDEWLGHGLAALHRATPPGFGLDHDNFIGPLPQSNRRAPGWATFYAEERLGPQLRRATDNGRLSPRLKQNFQRLLGRLDKLVGDPEPPARLHGDLWGGNLLCDEAGTPCLIDPAVYGGHREVDLAMMRLFGGFGAGVFAAYEEAHPLAAGHAERVSLYQLYPLLVHVNLFGASYVASTEAALATLL